MKGSAKPGAPDRTALRSFGSILHDFYTAVEDIFELVAEDLDGGVPLSSDGHKRLLRNMSEEIPGVRPPVVGKPTAEQLEEYLGFRHVFRNVYGQRFRSYLEQLAEQLESDE